MANGSSETSELWTVLITLGTGVFGLATAAIGHLHMRIDRLQRRLEAGREMDEKRRSDAQQNVWTELRRMNDADREYRERMLTLLRDQPTRDEMNQALDRLVKRIGSD